MPCVQLAEPLCHRGIEWVVMEPFPPVFFQCFAAFAEFILLQQDPVGGGYHRNPEIIQVQNFFFVDKSPVGSGDTAGVPKGDGGVDRPPAIPSQTPVQGMDKPLQGMGAIVHLQAGKGGVEFLSIPVGAAEAIQTIGIAALGQGHHAVVVLHLPAELALGIHARQKRFDLFETALAEIGRASCRERV